jgi:DNA-binding CsgD family transcriptional regulator
MSGEIVVLADGHDRSVDGTSDWSRQSAGLSPRQAEILTLITQGLSNEQIADCTYLTINTVKTYIRHAYRKIGVQTRTQAVLWGVANGFQPDGRKDH